METHPMFMDQNINIVMMAMHPKLIYRFSILPIEIPVGILLEVDYEVLMKI